LLHAVRPVATWPQDRYTVAMREPSDKPQSLQGSEITPAQCRMARAAVSLGVRDLATAAGVSTNTITRLERGETLHARTVARVRAALESAGVEFIAANGGGPGIRLRNWRWHIEVYKGNVAPPLPPEYFPDFQALFDRLREVKLGLDEADVVNVHCPSSATQAQRDAIKAIGGVPN
jgi:transcriptional regulator with XRE-family HTH domain